MLRNISLTNSRIHYSGSGGGCWLHKLFAGAAREGLRLGLMDECHLYNSKCVQLERRRRESVRDKVRDRVAKNNQVGITACEMGYD